MEQREQTQSTSDMTGIPGAGDADTAAQSRQDTGGAMDTSVPSSPVDDRTYNLLQALTSKLEAIEAYEIYEQDDDNGLFTELIAEERRHAERLLEELRRSLSAR